MKRINPSAVLQQFQAQFPHSSNVQTVWAPGRVNLLGEHTDYNGGFVFPMAINAGICVVGTGNGTNQVNLYSLDYHTSTSFTLDRITPSETDKWINYVQGVCDQFQKLGYSLQGMDLILEGNVPQGAGLSSSAALEVAIALFIANLHDFAIDRVELVKLAQRAENQFVGVASGIMDQFASMMGQKDHALFLDCRSLDYKLIPTPFEREGYAVVVVNSGVKRGLVGSEYNARRQQCEEAVALLQDSLPHIQSLRDVTIENLSLVNELPSLVAKRARHVITENDRVVQGINTLAAGDVKQFGEFLNASHQSLRDDFEVSCPELDLLVTLAQGVPGVLGSRMTGAGFGGCTVSLVPQVSLPLFKKAINDTYEKQTGLQAEIFVFNASPGAHIL